MNNPLGNTLVFGGSVGSEGKGAIVGHLARKYPWSAAICTFMTNAGHTFVGDLGENVVVQQLPMAVVAQEIPLLLIAPGSAITVSQLFKEIEALESVYNVADRLHIHPRAMIIEEEDVEYEKQGTKHLASTAKGCGHALARKVLRKQNVRLARDIPALKAFLADTTKIVNDIIDDNGNVLIEGSQGFDLDINHGIEYPFCTSRGTTPMQVLADCGIGANVVEETIAVLRTYPIRVGHVVENGEIAGNSGPFGGKELTWDEITRRSGSPTQLAEYTTVTKRLRRIFEMDFERLLCMAQVCRPTSVALTFADYIDANIRSWTDDTVHLMGGLPMPVKNFVANVQAYTGAPVNWLKTGPRDRDLITL